MDQRLGARRHGRRIETESEGIASATPWKALSDLFCLRPSPQRNLLIGGCKVGDKRFYKRMVPVADKLYEVYLAELRKEGLI